jgi:hypothetical protein
VLEYSTSIERLLPEQTSRSDRFKAKNTDGPQKNIAAKLLSIRPGVKRLFVKGCADFSRFSA